MNIVEGYSFDDVLLIPNHSSIESRKNIDLSVTINKSVKLNIPIACANMKSVVGPEMAIALSNAGGMPIMHRFDQLNTLLNNYQHAINTSKYPERIAISVGVSESSKEIAREYYNAGAKIMCVDVAHGDHDNCFSMVEYIKNISSDITVIAGNVVTYFAAMSLIKQGADIIKCGIGNGASCSTRVETGNGYPQLSALENVFNIKKEYPDKLILADGGMKNAGDIVKALCFSDFVMTGSMLAGTDESPGKILEINKQKYKEYAGSSTHTPNNVEGVVGFVPYKGSLENILKKLSDGIRSGCSYQGVDNLNDLKQNPRFVKISHAGLTESKPHSLLGL